MTFREYQEGLLKLDKLIHLLYLFIWLLYISSFLILCQLFTECLPCAQHCTRYWQSSRNIPNESHTGQVFLLFSSVILPENLQDSRHHVGLFLLNSTERMVAKSNTICLSTHQSTYILCPEIDACTSSSFLGPPPLSDGQPSRILLIQICFLIHFCPFPLQLQCLWQSLNSQNQGLKIYLSIAGGNWCRVRVLTQKEMLAWWVCLAELGTSGDDRQAGNNPQYEILEIKSI